jgi:hypothetical protein
MLFIKESKNISHFIIKRDNYFNDYYIKLERQG